MCDITLPLLSGFDATEFIIQKNQDGILIGKSKNLDFDESGGYILVSILHITSFSIRQ